MKDLWILTAVSVTLHLKLVNDILNLCLFLLRELEITALHVLKGTLHIAV